MDHSGKRSMSERLHELRDSFREDIREKHRHTMLAQRRASIERDMMARKGDPTSHQQLQMFITGHVDSHKFITSIHKYSVIHPQRNKLFRYFTPAVVDKLCQVLIEANRLPQQQLPNSLKMKTLGILTNYYLDFNNAPACWRGLQELLRMYNEEESELRSFGIICLANMCKSVPVKDMLIRQSVLINNLAVYNYNSDDAEDVFYLVLMLSINMKSRHLSHMLGLLPMLKRVFFTRQCDRQTRESILECVGKLALHKQMAYFQMFAKEVQPFFMELYSEFRTNKLDTELNSTLVDLLYELFKDVESACDELVNRYAVGFLTLLLLQADDDDLDAIAASYRKIIKSFISIARMRPQLVTEDRSLLHIIDSTLSESCSVAHNGCPLSLSKNCYVEFIYLAIEVILLSGKTPVDWTLCCRHAIRCIREESVDTGELVQQLSKLFQLRFDLLGEFIQQNGMAEISKLSRKGQDEETREVCFNFTIKYDKRPDIPFD